MEAKFFKTAKELRHWFQKNHDVQKELIVGFYKKGVAKPSVTYKEAVDEALCVGWIDGVRRKIDEESYCNRFTPRRKNSNWSEINTKRAEELIKANLMNDEGIKAFEKRGKSKN